MIVSDVFYDNVNGNEYVDKIVEILKERAEKKQELTYVLSKPLLELLELELLELLEELLLYVELLLFILLLLLSVDELEVLLVELFWSILEKF